MRCEWANYRLLGLFEACLWTLLRTTLAAVFNEFQMQGKACNQWSVHIHNTGCFCGNLEKDGCSKQIWSIMELFHCFSLLHDGCHLQSYGTYNNPRQSLCRLSQGSTIQNNRICSMYGILTYPFTIKFNHPCN